MTGAARIAFVGGPRCGEADTVWLSNGKPPEIVDHCYAHAAHCHDRGDGRAHIYEWRPMHPRGHKPRVIAKPCHVPLRPGCPDYTRTEAT